MSLRNEPRSRCFGRTQSKNTRELALDLNTPPSAICHHMKKLGKGKGSEYDKEESTQPTTKVKLHRRKKKGSYAICWDHHIIIPFEFLNCNQAHNED